MFLNIKLLVLIGCTFIVFHSHKPTGVIFLIAAGVQEEARSSLAVVRLPHQTGSESYEVSADAKSKPYTPR